MGWEGETMRVLRRIKIWLIAATAAVLLCAVSPAALAEEIEGSFPYTTSGVDGDKTQKECHFVYRDSFFSCSSYELNMDLVAMSIRMALAGVGIDPDAQPTRLLPVFDRLGVVYSEDTVKYVKPGADTIGYAFGERKISETESVIVAVVRGGNYKQEWASNFTVGHDPLHKGFTDAAVVVSDALKSYILSMPEGKKVSVWISGFSRGAAVTNMTAYMLDNYAENGELGAVKPENIYAFCFEAPQPSQEAYPGDDQALYKNIFSFVNEIDPVTKVAPSAWGYKRYGITFFLPSLLNCEQYFELSPKVQELFCDYAGVKEYELSNEGGQAVLLDRVLKKISDYVGSPAMYEQFLQNTIRSFILGDDVKANVMMEAIRPIVQDFVDRRQQKEGGDSLVNIGAAHAPELCMAWIDVVGDGKVLTECSDRYEFVALNAAGTVTVYDASGKKVAFGNGSEAEFDVTRRIGAVYSPSPFKEFLFAFPAGEKYIFLISPKKRDRADLDFAVYDRILCKEAKGVKYNNALIKKDEEAVFVADSKNPRLYICGTKDSASILSKLFAGEQVANDVKKPDEVLADVSEIPSGPVIIAVEPSPTPTPTPIPTPTVSPEASTPEPDAEPDSDNDIAGLLLIIGIVSASLVAIALVVLLVGRIINRKNASVTDVDESFEPAAMSGASEAKTGSGDAASKEQNADAASKEQNTDVSMKKGEEAADKPAVNKESTDTAAPENVDSADPKNTQKADHFDSMWPGDLNNSGIELFEEGETVSETSVDSSFEPNAESNTESITDFNAGSDAEKDG